MGYIAIRITPETIIELIAAGHLVIDKEFYASTNAGRVPLVNEIPKGASFHQWSFQELISPHGQLMVVLEHDDLWKVAPGAEFPQVAIKVNS